MDTAYVKLRESPSSKQPPKVQETRHFRYLALLLTTEPSWKAVQSKKEIESLNHRGVIRWHQPKQWTQKRRFGSDDFPFQTGDVQVPAVSFRECNYIDIKFHPPKNGSYLMILVIFRVDKIFTVFWGVNSWKKESCSRSRRSHFPKLFVAKMEGFACDLYTSTTNVKILVVTGILGKGTTKIQISRFFVHQADCFSEEPTSKWKCWEQQQPHNHKHNHSHNQLILSLLPALKLQQEFGANPIQWELGFAVLHGLFLESLLGGSSQDRRKWLGSPRLTSHRVRPFWEGAHNST